jgi:hypothetical protein
MPRGEHVAVSCLAKQDLALLVMPSSNTSVPSLPLKIKGEKAPLQAAHHPHIWRHCYAAAEQGGTPGEPRQPLGMDAQVGYA